MTVTINQPKQVDARTWLVTWGSTVQNATYRIFKDGALIKITQETSMQFQVEAGENLVIEILDDTTTVALEAFPGRLTLGWNASLSTDHYKVEELILSVWTLRATIIAHGQGFFSWTSRFLEDVTIHSFRIIPVGLNGNDGTAKTLISLMVRNPDIPAQIFVYNGSVAKTVTVS